MNNNENVEEILGTLWKNASVLSRFAREQVKLQGRGLITVYGYERLSKVGRHEAPPCISKFSTTELLQGIIMQPGMQLAYDDRNLVFDPIDDKSHGFIAKYNPSTRAIVAVYTGVSDNFDVINREFYLIPLLAAGTYACFNHKCPRVKSVTLTPPNRAAFTAEQGFKCGGCGFATYCSRECQVADWKPYHKKHCVQHIN